MAAPLMSNASTAAAGSSSESPPVSGSFLSSGIVSSMTPSLGEVVVPTVVGQGLEAVVSPVVVPVVVVVVPVVVPVVVVPSPVVVPVVVPVEVGQLVVAVVVPPAVVHAPRLSPWSRWVATADSSTVIVSSPSWQRVTFP